LNEKTKNNQKVKKKTFIYQSKISKKMDDKKIKQLNNKHSKAMKLARIAEELKSQGKETESIDKFAQAADLEYSVVTEIKGDYLNELVLGTSAATLYFDARNYDKARTVANEYLEIAKDTYYKKSLKDLIKRIDKAEKNKN